MARPGPKPQPTATKKLRGNPGRRPLSEREPEVKASKLTPPRWLGDEAKKEWKRVAPVLLKAKVATALDRAILTSYCEAWGAYIQACKDLAKYGGAVLVSKKTGQAYLSPWLNAKSMAEKQMRVCAVEMGMSPSSRSRVQVSGDDEPDTTGKGRFFNGPGLRIVG